MQPTSQWLDDDRSDFNKNWKLVGCGVHHIVSLCVSTGVASGDDYSAKQSHGALGNLASARVCSKSDLASMA